MSSGNFTHAKVRHTPLTGMTAADCLSTLDDVCSAGAQCPAVQGSPLAKHALLGLQTATANAHTSLTNRQALAQALMAAIKTLAIDVATAKSALSAYEAVVESIADGDSAVINQAGLLSRDSKSAAAMLGNVSGVSSKPGKSIEAILSWPRVPGADTYAIEVNYTPQSQGGTWTALASGSSRRRVVKGPAPAAQFLARVAAAASDGTTSDWSDPVLVTAR